MRLGAEHSAEESSGCAGEQSLAKLLSKEGREGNSSCSLGSRTSVSQQRGGEVCDSSYADAAGEGQHRLYREFEVC